jgi:type IV secretion system protein VirB8
MLEKLKGYLTKKDSDPNKKIEPDVKKRNWFDDRYHSIILQRNLLFLLMIISVVVVVIAISAISYVATSKEFEPFVIEIQKDTGVTTIVNPISSDLLGGNDALARYFIKKYVSARETYNIADFNNRARLTVRLMSSPQIYSQYLQYIRNDENNPSLIYGSDNITVLQSKSWSKLEDGSFVYRFSIQEISGQKRIYNKIVIIRFEYDAIQLTEDQQDINPVGFIVTAYRVDNDNS